MLVGLNAVPLEEIISHQRKIPFSDRLCTCAVGKTDILKRCLLERALFMSS